MNISATELNFRELNGEIKSCADSQITVDSCLGQRYIASGLSNKSVTVNGTPGNALGSYLDGATINVYGNAQDATGDTMNDGKIIIHGNAGDATGYSMRGGKIFVEGNCGFRAGIHMKAYKDKTPLIIIGKTAGSFLGEYQAGGTIIVLGLGTENATPVGEFCSAGMHGGKIFIRGCAPKDLSEQILLQRATKKDMDEIDGCISEFCKIFDVDKKIVTDKAFYVLTPNTSNPYKRLYTPN